MNASLHRHNRFFCLRRSRIPIPTTAFPGSPKNTIKTPKSQYIKPEKTLLVRYKVALLNRPKHNKRANCFYITFSKGHVMTETDTLTLDRELLPGAGLPSSIITVRPWRKIK